VGADVAAVGAQVRELVAERTSLDPSALAAHEPLVDLGVDSIALLSVVVGVEERFGIEVADTDVVPEHFGTVEGITQFVATRLAG
jgi:acyl carrier protein